MAGYVAAFEALGYSLRSQYDWSAEREDGVCLTVWTHESQIEDGRFVFDTRQHEKARSVSQQRQVDLRARLARRAIDEFDGIVDVVYVSPSKRPGVRVGTADPWRSENRRGHCWRVVDLDQESGQVRLETFVPNSKDA